MTADDLSNLTAAGFIEEICSAFELGLIHRLVELRGELARRDTLTQSLAARVANLDTLCDSVVERTNSGDMIIISGSRIKRLDITHWDVNISHDGSRAGILRAIQEACTLPKVR